MRIKTKLLIFASLCTVLGQPVYAGISITLTGNWNKTIDASDLQSGAGSNLISSHESASNAAFIDIFDTTGTSDNWRVDVKKIDTSWHSSLHLDVKRTSDGTGSGAISGGSVYQEVTGTDQSFFSGSGDRSSIDVQLKVRGMSVQVSPNTYSTTIYYTVVDTF